MSPGSATCGCARASTSRGTGSRTTRPDAMHVLLAGRDADAAALGAAAATHTIVRAALYPEAGPPRWTGAMLWRGAVEWPVFADGPTMLIAGGMRAKFVLYPIHADPSRPGTRLTNWL